MASTATPQRRMRACLPCHDRKVRCDAGQTGGPPCTRCRRWGQVDACVLADRRARRKRAPEDRPPDPELALRSSHNLQTPPLDPPWPTGPTPPVVSANTLLAEPNTTTSSLRASGDSDAVQEDDAELQICREISNGGTQAIAPAHDGQNCSGREIIVYYEGTNPVTILGNVFSNTRPKKLVRIVVNDANCDKHQSAHRLHLPREELDYLQSKGALTLPPQRVCITLLRRFFECVYPYIPVFDRMDVIRDYQDNYTSLLLQSVLAAAIPYVSLDVLREAGFLERSTAQKVFFGKAKALYNMGAERGPFRLLQSSIVLSLIFCSFAADCDYRFWIANAMRLATQIGLHRNDSIQDLDIPTRKLFRRVWWVLYNRDALNAVAGLDNVLRAGDFDTAPLTMDDWEDDQGAEMVPHILDPVTGLHKTFILESCRLSTITVRFLRMVRSSESLGSVAMFPEFEKLLADWRASLGPEMFADRVHKWTVSNFWILVLKARSWLFECIFYHTWKARLETDDEMHKEAMQKLESATFELDTILIRLRMHDVDCHCPLFIFVCAFFAVAFHIERALDQSIGEQERNRAYTRLQNSLSNLRALAKTGRGIRWTRRMLEYVTSKMRELNLNSTISASYSSPVGNHGGCALVSTHLEESLMAIEAEDPNDREALAAPVHWDNCYDVFENQDWFPNVLGADTLGWLHNV